MSDKQLIILSAGGTAGHLFPAHALAADLLSRGWRVLLVTDDRGLRFQGTSNIACQRIASATLGAGILGKLRGVVQIGLGIVQSWKILRREKPAAVIGFGGYPSFPPVWTAQKTGIPTILHEQNGALGKANLWLAAGADKIALSLPQTTGIPAAATEKTVVTGNPIRAVFFEKREIPYTAPEKDGAFRIFLMGGSQGAGIFSQIVPAACAALPGELKARLRIVQQCRAEDMAAVKEIYARNNIQAEIDTFFADSPERLAACHLFIGRSGATTLAEISALGRPSIFVPLMVHADQQQKKNAEAVTRSGGGWIMLQNEFTVAALKQKLEELMAAPDILQRAAAAAKACDHPGAAEKLGDLVIAVAQGKAGVMRPFDETHMKEAA